MPHGDNLKTVHNARNEVALIYAYLLEKALFSKLDKKVSQRGAVRLLNGKGILSITGKNWRLCTIQPMLKRIEFLKTESGLLAMGEIENNLIRLEMVLAKFENSDLSEIMLSLDNFKSKKPLQFLRKLRIHLPYYFKYLIPRMIELDKNELLDERFKVFQVIKNIKNTHINQLKDVISCANLKMGD